MPKKIFCAYQPSSEILWFRAMDNVLNLTEYGLENGYVFCGGNIETAGKVTYYPIYMLMFLQKKELPDEIIFDTDFSDINEHFGTC